MELISNNPWTATIVGAVLILSVTGVLIGLLRTRDRGLMGNGERKWPRNQMPLLVAYTHEIPHAYISAFRQAMEEVNNLVGRLVFSEAVVDYYFTVPPVHILLDGCHVIGNAATTEIQYNKLNGEILACKISFRERLSAERLLAVCRHEIGHCLGLEHDETRESVMHPVLHINGIREFTDHDINLLKKIYG